MKFRPAVPRHWLFAISGSVWIAAGLILCVRAIAWLQVCGLATQAAIEAGSLILGIVGYVYVFSKIVMRNISRIHALPESVCAFAFTAWRGYIMIGAMVALGITLRNSSIPKYYISLPYGAMSTMLLIGSWRFFIEFVAAPK